MGKFGAAVLLLSILLVSQAQAQELSLSGSGTSTGGYWERFKALVRQAQASLFPPTLDFRAGGAWSWDGGGEGIKEAAGESLGNTKKVLEDSAKGVGQTVREAKDKMNTEKSSRGDDEL